MDRLDVIENDMGDETMPSDHKKLIGRQTANSPLGGIMEVPCAVHWRYGARHQFDSF